MNKTRCVVFTKAQIRRRPICAQLMKTVLGVLFVHFLSFTASAQEIDSTRFAPDATGNTWTYFVDEPTNTGYAPGPILFFEILGDTLIESENNIQFRFEEQDHDGTVLNVNQCAYYMQASGFPRLSTIEGDCFKWMQIYPMPAWLYRYEVSGDDETIFISGTEYPVDAVATADEFHNTAGGGQFTALDYYATDIGIYRYEEAQIFPPSSSDPRYEFVAELIYAVIDGVEYGDPNASVVLSTEDELPAAHAITVYPNPFIDRFYIEVDKSFSGTVLEVYDILGRRVSKSDILSGNNQLDIQLDDGSAGMYFIRFKEGQNGEIVLPVMRVK